MHRVLEDRPGRLLLEVVPGVAAPMAAVPGNGSGGLRFACSGCHQAEPGAPDLPGFAFNVAVGPAEPVVVLDIAESETRIVPEGVAPVPVSLDAGRIAYRRDPERFAAAGGLIARLGPPGVLRGARIRGIRVPLALWSEATHTLTVIKRLRISVAFPDARSQSGPSAFHGTFRREILNPEGAAYLPLQPIQPIQPRQPSLALPSDAAGTRPALRKASAMRSALGDSLIRIRIGDREPAGFEEDKVYALAFTDAVRIAPGLNGVLLRNLRLFSGPEDTLPRYVGGKAASGTLAEAPMQIRDAGANNVFDAGDTLFFYGHGTSIWKRFPLAPGGAPAEGRIRWRFSSDPYSFDNFLYLDFSGKHPGTALRLETETASAGPAAGPAFASAYHFLRAERDLKAFACEHGGPEAREDSATGFLWFWHWSGSCASGSRPAFLTAGQLADPETEFLKDAARGAGDSLFIGMFSYPYSVEDDFRVRLAGSTDALESVGKADGLGSWYVSTDAIPADGRLRIDSVYWGGRDRRFEGYTIAYRRHLILPSLFGPTGSSSARLWIFPEAYGRAATYRVQGGAGAICLRIAGGIPDRKWILDGEGSFTDSLGASDGARYLVYRDAVPLTQAALDLDRPSSGGRGIRDLAGADGKAPQYLIIAPRALAEEAVALKKYREDAKRALPLRTEVVLAEDIYREYSGGRLSPPALRDFLRWAYTEWGGRGPGGNPLQYVLLLGGGHFDYRNLSSGQASGGTANHIPPYEFLTGRGEGLTSDDFYALLDSGEVVSDGAVMDLSIGRVPARTAVEARDYLRKVAEYEDPALAGAWRGRVAFAADDGIQRGNTNDFDGIWQGHTTFTDNISRTVLRNEPGVTADQVFLLDYRFDAAYHKPEASQDLIALINQGTLAVTYVGHGANSQWADEALLQTNDGLARIANRGRTPILNSFSCTVGRFESIKQDGMSDRMVMARDKGAIAAVSATRESYPVENMNLAVAFYRRAFPVSAAFPDGSAGDPNANPGGGRIGGYATIGDALREAKNSNEYPQSNLNDARYNLLGEPVLLVRKPMLGLSFTVAPDTLKALDCASVEGRVEGGSGSGFVNLKILAGSTRKSWPGPKGSTIDTQYADIRGAVLFEQTFAYRDGRFKAGYFIPKQVPFGDSGARIIAFAWDATQEREGMTAKEGLRIQGTSAGACAQDQDGKGPRIRITGCEPKETGGLDFPDRVRLALPYCLEIQVEDSSGGVLSSDNPDEGTTLQIPGILDAFHPRPGLDGLYRKVYRMPLDPAVVPPGDRTLKVTARDGYGNASQRLLRMDLTMDSSVNTVSAYNVPNPMKRNGTRFYFSTALPARTFDFADPGGLGDRVAFEIRIFDQRGRLVKVMANAVSGEAAWDGRDAWGNLQANGVYFYRITARQNRMEAGETPGYKTISSKRNVLVISR
jgi:hypothetical protein